MSRNEFTCDCTAVHEDVVRLVGEKLGTETRLEQAASFFRILGDPTRMKIIRALDCHEMCVCDLANVLSMTKSAVSHQLATMRRANIVRFRRELKTVYYALSDEHVHIITEIGLAHAGEAEGEA